MSTDVVFQCNADPYKRNWDMLGKLPAKQALTRWKEKDLKQWERKRSLET